MPISRTTDGRALNANLTSRLFELRSTFLLVCENFATPGITAIGYCDDCFSNHCGRIMWIPGKIYEGLPAIYLTIGSLNILGATYIGLSHGLMPGYAVLGLSCMIAGFLVRSIRRNARSAKELPPHEGLNPAENRQSFLPE